MDHRWVTGAKTKTTKLCRTRCGWIALPGTGRGCPGSFRLRPDGFDGRLGFSLERRTVGQLRTAPARTRGRLSSTAWAWDSPPSSDFRLCPVGSHPSLVDEEQVLSSTGEVLAVVIRHRSREAAPAWRTKEERRRTRPQNPPGSESGTRTPEGAAAPHDGDAHKPDHPPTSPGKKSPDSSSASPKTDKPDKPDKPPPAGDHPPPGTDQSPPAGDRKASTVSE
ncbi:hypothetical protein MTO96_033677 [Rhipicephalus appendiculatus]